MTTSQRGIDLIKKYEGLRLKAYKCPAGIWTCGWGHIKNVTEGMVISQQQAEEFLKDDLKYFEVKVMELVKISLSQNQFDALVSFCYNLGEGRLKKSTLLKKLNSGDIAGAAEQFMVWNKANGKVLSGLTTRRNEERSLFTQTF